MRGDGGVDTRRCGAVQLLLSEGMDDAGAVPPDAERHAAVCPRCSSFHARAWRVRELARFDVAPEVPDLVPSIMARVTTESRRRLGAPGRLGLVRLRPGPAGPTNRAWVRPAAVAACIGLIAGFFVTGGALRPSRRSAPEALAADVPRELRRAALQLRGYQATFRVTELHWTRAVPRRTFVVRLAFRAPEDFSVRVADTTRYPSAAWPRNDLSLVTDGNAWRASGPDPCPAAALPVCPSSAPIVREIVGRPPFDADTPAPTDLIVPMTVLAAENRVDAVGTGTVAGHPAVAVALPYDQATPLFRALTFAGSWRPFYPQDRVIVWLDRETWFPLGYDVYPAAGPDRALWAAQQGLPGERPRDVVFSATATSFSRRPPVASLFLLRAGRHAQTERFATSPVVRTTRWPTPKWTAGLAPVRAGSSPGPGTGRALIVAYAKGLTWLTVTRVTGWHERRTFGVGPFASPVGLGAGGRGWYEPASQTAPRRVALHTASGEFLVDSNLTRAALLKVAASLPLSGLPAPPGWLVHRSAGTVVRDGLLPNQAIASATFPILVPTYLPAGYTGAAAQTSTSRTVRAVTILYRSPTAQLDGEGIRLYQATAQTIAPPTDPGALAVLVRGVVARWSPDGQTLEWLDGDVYRSISAPGMDLATVVRIAESLRAPG